MKEAEITSVVQLEYRESRQPASRELELALLKFVEALAIADARRDHLALKGGHQAPHNLEFAKMPPNSEIGENETRSDLRPVLNRASERKID